MSESLYVNTEEWPPSIVEKYLVEREKFQGLEFVNDQIAYLFDMIWAQGFHMSHDINSFRSMMLDALEAKGGE